MTETPNEEGKTASVPHTSLNGDIPIEFLLLTSPAHNASTNFLCHLLLLSCNIFLIMLTRLLLDDLAKKLP